MVHGAIPVQLYLQTKEFCLKTVNFCRGAGALVFSTEFYTKCVFWIDDIQNPDNLICQNFLQPVMIILKNVRIFLQFVQRFRLKFSREKQYTKTQAKYWCFQTCGLFREKKPLISKILTKLFRFDSGVIYRGIVVCLFCSLIFFCSCCIKRRCRKKQLRR